MKTHHPMLSNNLGILLASLLLSACYTGGGKKDNSDCEPGYVRVTDEETKTYTCISESEYEEIMDELIDPIDPG